MGRASGKNAIWRDMRLSRSVRLGLVAFGAAALASVFAMERAQAASEPAPVGGLAAQVELDRGLVVRGSVEPLYVMINLEAGASTESDADRPPLNLALVLDRSGSMEDAGKIDYLKTAAKLMVEQLDERDRLAIVEYDDKITVMWPSDRVTSVTPIKRLIDGLQPRGGTDLTGGMLRGVDETKATLERRDLAENTLTRVILLSDGLANRGITDPNEIRQRVREARREGVRISTMGLGRDYDEDLMQDIAENAGGAYYYVEHPRQIARIFEEELNTLFTTVVRDASFRYEPTDAIERAQLLTFEEASQKGIVELDLGSFYAEESRTMVLKLEPSAEAFDRLGQVDLGMVDIAHTDPESGITRRFETTLTIDVTTDIAEADKARNEAVVIEATLIETEIEQRAAVAAFERGEVDQANQILGLLNTKVESLADEFQDDRLRFKMEALEVEQAQMEEAAAAPSPEATQSFLKASKNRLYQAKTGKRTLYNLQEGDKGLEVERLQEALAKEGFYTGDIDGVYDEDVSAAVKAYQEANNLDADGIAGPATKDALALF